MCLFGQLVVVMIIFAGHYGSLCSAHNQRTENTNFCSNFSMEIMITGYVLFLLVIFLFLTSIPWMRRRISYEAFYYTHHLFIPFYVVSCLQDP
jgi:DMSO/TMAO reductase YedYZ heme-binding membrane subunit